ETRCYFSGTQAKKGAHEGDMVLRGGALELLPRQLGGQKSLSAQWVQRLAPLIAFVQKLLQLLLAGRPDLIREISFQVGKIEKRIGASPFLTHEQQRNMWGKQVDHGQAAEGLGPNQVRQAFTERPISGLVVILQK